MSTSQTLGQTISAYLAESREADPHVITEALLPTLTAEHREQLIWTGLLYQVRRMCHSHRTSTDYAAFSSAPPVPSRKAGPSKWKVSIPIRVNIGGVPKLIDECGFSDLKALAEEYRGRGRDMLSKAREADQLADVLRSSGCRTVGELRASQSEEVAA